jgi:hypothetical protein
LEIIAFVFLSDVSGVDLLSISDEVRHISFLTREAAVPSNARALTRIEY